MRRCWLQCFSVNDDHYLGGDDGYLGGVMKIYIKYIMMKCLSVTKNHHFLNRSVFMFVW